MRPAALPAPEVPFVATGAYPTRPGNAVRPWIDGEPAFRRVCERIEAARHAVWATVTFLWPSFRMPDGRGSALDVLERAARRGVDVRVVFWRPDDETAALRPNAFWGAPAHQALLARQYPHVNVRWDRAHPGYCQHQKTWLVDPAGDAGAAFVGGLNLNPHTCVRPGHAGDGPAGAGHYHDLYVEIAGPAVADVQHNFVQRWNEASERRAPDGRHGPASGDALGFPARMPPPRGGVDVQIQRTTHAGRYTDGHPPPGGAPFPIARGERTIRDQYRAALYAARRTIYLEHQHLDMPEVVDALDAALARGVRVVALVPAATPPAACARLARHAGFTLCGIAGHGAGGRRTPVHVHAKLMIVDDAWASVGSANGHRWSLEGNGELNAAFRDPTAVRALRTALFAEHLGTDTAALDDVAALTRFRQVARDNRRRHAAGDAAWQGLALDLAPDEANPAAGAVLFTLDP